VVWFNFLTLLLMKLGGVPRPAVHRACATLNCHACAKSALKGPSAWRRQLLLGFQGAQGPESSLRPSALVANRETQLQ